MRIDKNYKNKKKIKKIVKKIEEENKLKNLF